MTRINGLQHHPSYEPMNTDSPRSSRSSGFSSSNFSPSHGAPSRSPGLARSTSNQSLLGTIPSAPSPSHKRSSQPKAPLRKGKWTPEEEVYAHYIIDNFNKGLINLSRGKCRQYHTMHIHAHAFYGPLSRICPDISRRLLVEDGGFWGGERTSFAACNSIIYHILLCLSYLSLVQPPHVILPLQFTGTTLRSYLSDRLNW